MTEKKLTFAQGGVETDEERLERTVREYIASHKEVGAFGTDPTSPMRRAIERMDVNRTGKGT